MKWAPGVDLHCRRGGGRVNSLQQGKGDEEGEGILWTLTHPSTPHPTAMVPPTQAREMFLLEPTRSLAKREAVSSETCI